MVFFLAFCILFSFVIGITTVFILGIKKHVFYLFITAIHILYVFNTPFRNYIIEDFMANNANIKDYFGYGFFIILLHITLFNIAYFATPHNVKYLRIKLDTNNEKIKKTIFNLFMILYAVIFMNTLAGGVNLIDVILGRANRQTLGLQGATYYIQNFADSLITLLVAAYIFKVDRKRKMLMNILGLVLFIILGFRYRILLTVFSLVLYNIYTRGVKLRKVIRYLTMISVFLYAVLFLTINRVELYSGRYDNITFDPVQFDYDVFFNQARGSLVDFAIYKAMDEKTIESDYGATMFLYVFVKMTPASFFPNHTKPYPPPQMTAIDTAIGMDREIGEASTMIGAFYYAFSIFGVILESLFLGYFIKRLTPYNAPQVAFLTKVMILMATFQFFTRGYFPQFVDHLAYMLFPIFFLKKATSVVKEEPLVIKSEGV